MSDASHILDRIPTEDEVRERLAENLREATVLRTLLRAARKNAQNPRPKPIRIECREVLAYA
ncbi:MAG TPA: hypothetical protein VFE47_12580 [Tepidisphaeraceae bacterium]|nr:hypothetical protein [Tepidisphaeraceae bacterium]